MTDQQKKDSGYDKNNKKDKVKDKKLDENKIKNSLKNNNSSGTNGMHNNNNNNNNNAIPLTKDHYMSIGEPRGKKSDDNLRGYSKSQNKLFNALVVIHNKPTNDNNNIRNNNDNNINGPFVSWSNLSSAPYQNGNTTASFTMAAFSGDGSSPEPEEVFPEKTEPEIIDVSSSPAVSSSSSTILSSPPFRPSSVQKQSPGVIVHTHTLLAISCCDPFKINNNMNVLFRVENNDSYSYILNIFDGVINHQKCCQMVISDQMN